MAMTGQISRKPLKNKKTTGNSCCRWPFLTCIKVNFPGKRSHYVASDTDNTSRMAGHPHFEWPQDEQVMQPSTIIIENWPQDVQALARGASMLTTRAVGSVFRP